MNPETNNNEFDRFLKQSMNSDVPPEVEAHLRNRLAAFRVKMESAAAERRERPGRVATLFLSWRRTLSFAAPVAAAAVVGLILYLTAGGFDPAKAYAQAVEHLRKARTMTFTVQLPDGYMLPQPGVPPMSLRMVVMCKEPGLIRQQMPEGIVAVVDLTQKKGITLIPQTMECVELDLSQMPADKTQVNLLEEVRKIPARATEILGRRVLDGRTVQDYRVTTEGLDTIVSLDVETGNIARMEGRFVNAPGMNMVTSDFRFDVPLDDSLFDLTPPEGYRRISAPMNLADPTEEDLLYLLRWWAAHNLATAFPPTLNPMEMRKKLTEMMKSGEVIENRETSSTEKLVQQSFRTTQGIMFLMHMAPENDWHYAGQGVKLGAADKAIFWYKPTGKETYRVIYGDMTVRDVTSSDLPTTAPAQRQP